jgi:broad specificity phosphatase PhoE
MSAAESASTEPGSILADSPLDPMCCVVLGESARIEPGSVLADSAWIDHEAAAGDSARMRIPIAAPELHDDSSAPRPAPAPSSGSGARVWLVRHADVHDDWQQCAYGCMDVPLSVEGERQTHATAERFAALPITLVASSNLSRALAMGSGIAASTHAPLAIDPRLREVSRGAWQGLPTDEFRRLWHADARDFAADPWNWKGHAGESDADLFARGWPALLESVQRARGGDVVIASHFNLIRALVTGALGWSGHESFAFRTRTARMCLLIDAPGGWQLAARDADDPRDVAALV